MSTVSRAIVICLDRLSRRCLGCYGHEWIETPHLDRLASRAIVFDQHFVSPHRAVDLNESRLPPALDGWRDLGVSVRVLREESSEPDAEFAHADQSPFGKLVARAEQEVRMLARESASSWLLWLQSAGVDWPCVAASEFAELYADELNGNDHLPSETSDADEDADADKVDPLREAEVAYAACVTQLDHLLGRLLAAIQREFGDHQPLLILTALSGESLGEAESLPLSHVDTSAPEAGWRLRDELVHTPLLVAHPACGTLGSRRQELVEWRDVLATLHDWFRPIHTSDDFSESSMTTGGASLLPLIQNETVAWRDALFLADGDGNAAIRTTECLLVEATPSALSEDDLSSREPVKSSHSEMEPQLRLYVKPEDVWELNDVADQHSETIELLQARLREWRDSSHENLDVPPMR